MLFQNIHLGDKISGKAFANTARMEHREDLRKVGKWEKNFLLLYLFDMHVKLMPLTSNIRTRDKLFIVVWLM